MSDANTYNHKLKDKVVDPIPAKKQNHIFKLVAYVFTLILMTFAASKFCGENVMLNWWYWIFVGAISCKVIIGLLPALENKIAENIATVCIYASIIMLLATVVIPGLSVAKVRDAKKVVFLASVSEDVTLSRGQTLTYELGPNEATRWISAPTGVNYNIHPNNKISFRVFYWDKTMVDVPGDKDVGLPDVSPAKFKIINIGKTKEIYVVSGI